MTDGNMAARLEALERRLSETEALERRVLETEALARRVQELEDVNAIRRLHFAYGYFIDKCLYDEAVALFAREGELRFLNGIYHGQAGVRRLYCDWFRNHFTGGVNGPAHGLLLDHLMMQDIITVSADGQTAEARFRTLMTGGTHESRAPIFNFPTASWEGGVYENRYVKEDGVWKIAFLNYNMQWQADHHKGWDHDSAHLAQFDRIFPEDPLGPDRLVEAAKPVWPHTQIVPFHYSHPVN